MNIRQIIKDSIVPIENSNFVRDISTGAILQTDNTNLNEYMAKKKAKMVEIERNANIEKRLSELENKLPPQIKELIKDIAKLTVAIESLKSIIGMEHD